MNKILSVAVAAYNVADYIEDCLSSFTQCKRLSDMEIIIVDNGATDSTPTKVKNFLLRYPGSFKLIHSVCNRSYGAVINDAIKEASGKYFKTVDGDDWIDSEALDKLIAVLERTNVDVVINNYKEVHGDCSVFIDLHGQQTYGELITFEDIDHPQKYPMHGITVCRQLYKNHALPITEYCCYVDTEYVFWVMILANSFIFLKDAVYQYRLGRSGQSVSEEGIYKYLDDILILWKRLMKIYLDIKMGLSDTKKIYLLHFLSRQYRVSISWFALISKTDKDYKLKNFLQETEKSYEKYIKTFNIGIYSLIYLPWPIGLYILRILKKNQKIIGNFGNFKTMALMLSKLEMILRKI